MRLGTYFPGIEYLTGLTHLVGLDVVSFESVSIASSLLYIQSSVPLYAAMNRFARRVRP